MKKRVLSLLLALALCLTLLPVPALAEEAAQEPDSAASTENAVASVTMTAYNGAAWTGTYTDLLEAFAAARMGRWTEGSYEVNAETVSVELLNANTTYTLSSNDYFPISFEYSHNVTVDLNGCTLERNVAEYGYGILSINNGQTDVTFKNGTLRYTSSAEYGLPTAIDLAAGTLTLESMTITAVSTAEYISAYAVYANNESKLNILSGTYDDIGKSGSATVKLSGGFYHDLSTVYNHANLLAPGYIFADSNGAYIDPSTMGYDSSTDDWKNCSDIKVIPCPHPSFVDGKCSQCGSTCQPHKRGSDGKCTTCGQLLVAYDNNNNWYVSLSEAFAGVADNGRISLVEALPPEQVTYDYNKSVTLSGLDGQPLTYNYNDPTLTVSDGSLTIAASQNESPLPTIANTREYYAVSLTGGTLKFEGAAILKGGIYMTGGTLDGGLKAGTILTKNPYGAGSVSIQLSEGWGITALDLLAPGCAFAKATVTTDSTTNITTAAAGEIVNGNVTYLNEDVIVVAHTHSFGTGSECACGFTCDHSSGFEGGSCKDCGAACPHKNIGANGLCSDCNTKLAAKAELSGTVTWYTSASDAIKNAPDGSTVTLLQGEHRLTGDVRVTKTLTLDLNGQTLQGAALTVGETDLSGNPTGDGQLTVIDSGSSGNGRIGITVRGNGTLIFNPGNKTTTLSQLQVYNSAKVQLYGGKIERQNNLTLDEGIKLTDLLPTGYAYNLYLNLSANPDTAILYSNASKNDMSAWKSGHNLVIELCCHPDFDANGVCLYCNTEVTATLEQDGTITCYSSLEDAVTEADKTGGTVKLLKDVTLNEGLLLNGSSTAVTLDLNGKTLSSSTKTTLTCSRDNVTVKNGTIAPGTDPNNPSKTFYAIHVNGGLTLENVTAKSNGTFAVEVNRGSSLAVNGGVYQGLRIHENALTVKLNSGSFTQPKSDWCSILIYSDNEPAPTYTNVADLLAEGHAFAKRNADGTSGDIVNGNVTSLNEDVIVVEHTHIFGTDSTCDCGFVCRHPSLGFKNGVCGTCGYHCPHTDVMTDPWNNVSCAACHAQMAVKVTKGDTTTYYAKLFESNGYTENTLKQVFMNAQNDSTITLLADGLEASAWVEGKNIKLNLNGKKLSEGNGIIVTSNGDTTGQLTVTGEGSSTTPAGTDNSVCTFRVTDGGTLVFDDDFSGKFAKIRVEGGTLTSNSTDMTFDALEIQSSGATISLKGGTFGKITCSGSKTLGSLLADGYAFQKSDNSYVPYSTEITAESPLTDVTVVQCPHELKELPRKANVVRCEYCSKALGAVLTTADDTHTAYSDLDDVLAAAKENPGCTVTMYTDGSRLAIVGSDARFTLDVNGYTLRGYKNATPDLSVESGANVTVKNAGVSSVETEQGGIYVDGSSTLTLVSSEIQDLRADGAVTLTGSTVVTGTITASSLTVNNSMLNGSVIVNGRLTFIEGGASGKITLGSGAAAEFRDPENRSVIYELDATKAASLTISGGYFGKITAPSEKTMSDCLADGYVLWQIDSQGNSRVADLTASTLEGVSVGTPPITAVTAENPTITVKYGESYTLKTTIAWAGSTSSPDVRLKWEYEDGGNLAYLYEMTPTLAGYETNSQTIDFLISKENGHYPTTIGTRTYVVTFTKDGYSKSCTFTVTLEKSDASVTKAPTAIEDLTYTGSAQPLVTAGTAADGTMMYGLAGESGTFSATIPTAKEAGTYKVWYYVNGDQNYASTAISGPIVVTIAPKEVTNLTIMVSRRTYNGQAQEPEVTVYDGNTFIPEREYTVTYANNKNVGTATVTIQNADGGNYIVSTATQNFTIEKAYLSVDPSTLTIYHGRAADYHFDMSTLLPQLTDGKEYGQIHWDSAGIEKDITSSSGYNNCTSVIQNGLPNLILRVSKSVNSTTEGNIGSFTIEVESDNYNTIDLTVNVYAANPTTPTGTPTLSKYALTYGEALSTIELSGSMTGANNEKVDGTFAWTQPDTIPDSGDYPAAWTFTPTEPKYAVVNGASTITVNYAALTNVSVTQTGTLTYNGDDQTATVAATATAVNGQNVTFTYSAEANSSTYVSTMPQFKTAGTHTVYYAAIAPHHNAFYGSFEVTIAPKEVTITGTTANNKVYDGNTTTAIGSVGTLSDNYDGDNLTIVSGEAHFDNKNVGTGKTVTFSDFSLGGSAAGNYSLTAQPTSAKADITPAELTITGTTAANKVYDGGTSATIANSGTLTGVIGNDTVTIVPGTAAFDNKNVGSRTVTFSGFKLGGADKDNYTLKAQPANTTAEISAKELTITGTTANSKTYDGSTTATIADNGTLTGVIDGDNVTIIAGTAAFDNKNVGTQTVTFFGFKLDGADKDNYTLKAQPASATASISAKSVTLTGGVTAEDRAYAAGNTSVTLRKGTLTFDGLVGEETLDVTLSGGTVATADAGANKPVAYTAALANGTNGGLASNYSLSSQLPAVTVTIQAQSVTPTVTLSGSTTYTGSQLTPDVSVSVGGTTLTKDTDYTVTYGENRNAGSAAGSVTVSPKAGSNYTFANVVEHFDIAQREVTLSGVTIQDKTYDGTPAATVDSVGALSGVVTGDDLHHTVTAVFTSKNVGTQTANLTVALTGSAAANYQLASASQTTATAKISAKSVTATVTAKDRVYDGSDTVELIAGTVDGAVDGDTVTVDVTGATGRMANANAEPGKAVTVTGVKLRGSDANNYLLSAQPTGVTVTIGRANSSCSAPAAKTGLIYNGSAQALVTAGSTSDGTMQYSLTGTDWQDTVPTGERAGSYTVWYKVAGDGNHNDTQPDKVAVSIARQPVTIPAADASTFTYNGKDQTYAIAANDSYTVAGSIKRNAGTYTVTVTLNDTDNYVWSDDTDAAKAFDFVIGKASVTITVKDKSAYSYDAAPDLSKPELDKDYTVSGLIGDDVLTTAPTLSYDPAKPDMSKTGDVAKIAASGADAGENYSITYVDGKLTTSVRPLVDLSYTIKATAGANGVISPAGNVSVRSGRDQSFTITPDQGYTVSSVLVDGKPVGAVRSYTFKNVCGSHTIEVTFARISAFADVAADSYYADAVAWAVENGITSGTDASHFSPNGVCTRAQAVTFLWRAAGSPVVNFAMQFSDVAPDAYYAEAVRWAVSTGITNGTGENTFDPDAVCTRAQIAALLWRAAGSPEVTGASAFSDVPQGSYYEKAVAWAVANGITTGTGSGKFDPHAYCTRAQIAVFLHRLYAGK